MGIEAMGDDYFGQDKNRKRRTQSRGRMKDNLTDGEARPKASRPRVDRIHEDEAEAYDCKVRLKYRR